MNHGKLSVHKYSQILLKYHPFPLVSDYEIDWRRLSSVNDVLSLFADVRIYHHWMVQLHIPLLNGIEKFSSAVRVGRGLTATTCSLSKWDRRLQTVWAVQSVLGDESPAHSQHVLWWTEDVMGGRSRLSRLSRLPASALGGHISHLNMENCYHCCRIQGIPVKYSDFYVM